MYKPLSQSELLQQMIHSGASVRLTSLNEFHEGHPVFATIVAVDRRLAPSYKSVATAYGLALQHNPDQDVAHQDARTVSKDGADHSEALVLATLHVLEIVPMRTKLQLDTTSEYISKALNEYRHTWKLNKWRNSQGEKPQYPELWMAIDEIIERKAIGCDAVHVPESEAKASPVFSFITELATHLRDEKAKKSGPRG